MPFLSMGISERLSILRQHLPGTQRPAEDERLLKLYWNRAELKKELGLLQNKNHALLEQLQKQQGLIARGSEQMLDLERYLGDPEMAPHALVYFQLRALWRTCSTKLARFSKHLQEQQQEQERRRQLLEFARQRRELLAELDPQLTQARATADALTIELKVRQSKLAALRGFWNYFGRRRLAEEITSIRSRWEAAASRVTDLGEQRAGIEQRQPDEFPGMSVQGCRSVNIAVIAYALQFAAMLTEGNLASMSKEANARRVFDVMYGSPEDCTRILRLLRHALDRLEDEKSDRVKLKERTEHLRTLAAYGSEVDTVPLADSVDGASVSQKPTSAAEPTQRTAGINVLADDYWNLYEALVR